MTDTFVLSSPMSGLLSRHEHPSQSPHPPTSPALDSFKAAPHAKPFKLSLC